MQCGAQALNARGILMTCSAGNDGLNTDTNPHPPSTLTSPNVIAVAASQSVLPLPAFVRQKTALLWCTVWSYMLMFEIGSHVAVDAAAA